MVDRVGQVLGNYKLLRLLGQGGFSDVYLAEHIHLNTYAAIKILHAQLADNTLEGFRTEARTLAHLKHPNIVQVLDFGVVEMTPYLAMQYALNGTLRQRHPRGAPVALNVVLSYVKPMAAALQYAHNQRLIHRDVKPENMLIGEQNQILLTDFGIAVIASSSRQASASFDPAGTAAYMAPELIQGKAVAASDQYALAICVYEWLTGVLPFNGSYMEIVSQQVSVAPVSLREKIPSLPVDVEEVVMIALHKDPQKRFGRIEAFAQALGQAAQGKPADVNVSQQKNTSEVSKMEVALVGPLGRTILGATKVTIGCASDNTLVLADAKVSAYHAELRPEGPYYTLLDLSNGYGTFVNEQMVYTGMPRMLQPGDVIRIGDTKFTFTMDSGAQKGASSAQYPAMQATRPEQLPPGPPNYIGSTGYGMGNLAGPPPQSNQPSAHPNAQMSTYISPYGSGFPPQQPPNPTPNYSGPQPAAQQPNYTPNYSGPQPSGQQPNYTPNLGGPQNPLPPNQTPSYSGFPPSQPSQPRRRPPTTAIVSAILAILLIIAGSVGFFVYHTNQVALDNTHATATAARTLANNQATATKITQQNATATVVAGINATATAVATSPYPSFTKVALDDSLTTANADWDVNDSCKFTTTGYQTSDSQKGTYQLCLHSGQYGAVAYQVTMVIQRGDCGGIVFRYTDANNFYIFYACVQGYYFLDHTVNGNASSLAKYDTNTAFQEGGVQNRLAVTLSYDTINLYINNRFLEAVTDQSLPGNQGQIGMFIQDVTNPTPVLYTNALVWTT